MTLPRTSEAQWLWAQRHGKVIPASRRHAGVLAFYPGADGTADSPGHVVMLTARNWIIEAYAPGVPVHVVRLGSMAGEQAPVGYADPAAGGA